MLHLHPAAAAFAATATLAITARRAYLRLLQRSHTFAAGQHHRLTTSDVVAREATREWTGIVGFGSLLSEVSARGTCPSLRNFRIARVFGWRRVFQHPAAIFFQRGIANLDSREISSLSAEPSFDDGSGFVVATFEVQTGEVGALLEREEEFDFADVPFYALDGRAGARGPALGRGYMCVRSDDAEVLGRRGLRDKYAAHGLASIWDAWGKPESGILPCPVYCRHCVLASTRDDVPAAAGKSFLDETYVPRGSVATWQRVVEESGPRTQHRNVEGVVMILAPRFGGGGGAGGCSLCSERAALGWLGVCEFVRDM